MASRLSPNLLSSDREIPKNKWLVCAQRPNGMNCGSELFAYLSLRVGVSAAFFSDGYGTTDASDGKKKKVRTVHGARLTTRCTASLCSYDPEKLPVKLEIVDVEKKKGISKYYVSPHRSLCMAPWFFVCLYRYM